MIRNVRPKDTTKFVIVKVIGKDVIDQSGNHSRQSTYPRKIYTVKSSYERDRFMGCKQRSANLANLLNIHCNTSCDQSTGSITTCSSTKAYQHNYQRNGVHFACVNARSLKNKVPMVTDHIINENIDICLFTETWLKDYDTVSFAGLSPTGYKFRNFSRQSERRGGGTGIMFRDSLDVRLSDAKENQSFEFSEWSVRVNQYVLNMVSVYRPPYSADHPISSRVFFDEFSSYLEGIVMTPGILLITGDFNFHVECQSDNDAKCFAEILQRLLHDYYTNILHETKRLYYANLIDDAAGDTKKLFGIVNSLCKADNRSDVLPSHDSPRKLANEFGNFFIKKVDLIQEDIDNITVTPPEVDHRYPDTKFETFSTLTDEDVHRIVMSSSNSTCSLDPNPTWLIKRCSDVLTPIITQMINLSLSEGLVPAQWKNAVVRPLLKKPGLDPVLKNFRPVSNLAFVGKAAEKAVIEQLINHCTTHQLLPVNQSSYRKYHSTETALVKVHNDILTSMDNQEVTFLILLDLSTAFDTINHSLLMNIVENDFGITGLAKKWLASYLGNRQQRITIKGCFSDYFHVNSGVPQGSCLGPVLFLLYASGLFNVASRHRTNIHAYADDTQVYLSFKPSLQYDMAKNIEQCITDLRAWMVSNRLLINDSKTEFLVIGSKHQLAKINVDSIMVGNTVIKSVTSVRNLGAWFDQHMSMNDHVSKVCSKAFYSLYNLRQVRKYLSDDTSKILVHSLVTCHLDYCNALLHDIPQHQQQRLQKVLNAAARFVYQLPKFCHITPVLKDLHWLPVKYRIMFKIILLVFKTLHGLAPTYLQDLIKVKPPCRYQLRSDDKFFLAVPKTKCKTFGDRAFYKAGPDLWNHLPLSLRNTNDLQKFKKDLKTHLFRVAFSEH